MATAGEDVQSGGEATPGEKVRADGAAGNDGDDSRKRPGLGKNGKAEADADETAEGAAKKQRSVLEC